MLQRVQSAADRAASKWRQSRGIDAGLRGLELGLLALAVSALLLELRPQGLQLEHGLPLLGWFLLGPALAGLAWARRPELEAAASRLDREAGLSDRLGTALEFAQDRSAMAELQRADAAEHAEQVDLDGLFPVPWRERLPRLAVAACLALLVTGAGLTFRLGPAPEIEPTEQAESAAEDLLATIDRERRVLLEEGNKEAVAVLTDLERTIRSIQVRQEELRRIVRQRQVDEPPDRELDLDLPEPSPLPTPAETGSEDLITAEDLERLEAETLEQLELTDAMEGQIVAELFSKTRKSKDLMAQFDGIMRNEMEHAHSAQDSSEFSLDQPDPFADTATGVDEVAESFSELGNALQSSESPLAGQEDLLRRDLSAETSIEHDRAHDQRESFNQFLQEFVKEVRDVVADTALGRDRKKKKKKKDEGRKVTTDTGQGMTDKADAMAESGFEEVDGPKRASGAAPPEEMMGSPEGGSPPEAGSVSEGTATSPNMMAMAGAPDGQTSAGASGAGRGGQDNKSGLSALMDAVTPQSSSGPLEQALSQLAAGRLPPEEREALFDRIARHQVQAGLASEADDVLVDYFAEAEALMVSNGESLPLLFRDYAQTYFDSIRPGASEASSTAR